MQGNLANGRVAVNLRVLNEGPKPWLEGTVTVNQFVGSLPFSRLTVDEGHIYFGKTTPINQPTLDIRAISKIRDYTVTAYIYGNAQAPRSSSSASHRYRTPTSSRSSPPELHRANWPAARIACEQSAILAVQSLWKKVFKRNSAKASLPAAQEGDTAGFMERFGLALGATDLKTGAREANAQFKFNEQIYFVGELDTQGRYTGALKYLLRFR